MDHKITIVKEAELWSRALMLAITNDDYELVRFFLSQGMKLNRDHVIFALSCSCNIEMFEALFSSPRGAECLRVTTKRVHLKTFDEEDDDEEDDEVRYKDYTIYSEIESDDAVDVSDF